MADERWGVVKAWGLRIGICVAVLPLFYVLSVGPAVLWCLRRQVDGTMTTAEVQRLERFYAPLSVATRNSKSARDVLDWYVDLWKPD